MFAVHGDAYSEKGLKEEAQRYGDAGPQPQVVWPNGVLASTSIGLFVQLVTPWHPHSTDTAYVGANGNDNQCRLVRGLNTQESLRVHIFRDLTSVIHFSI